MHKCIYREVEDYQFLANSIKRFGKITSLIYGTDGEVALEKGFENVYPIDGIQNIHLRCFEHLKDDIEKT